MHTLERLAHPGRSGRPRRTRISEHAPSDGLPGPPSHVLRPLRENLGASWPAHAHRTHEVLPPELAWAAPLFDPGQAVAVPGSHNQARQLIVWNNRLPTYQQTSFSCERLSAIRPTAGR